jgi:hypothetical protein
MKHAGEDALGAIEPVLAELRQLAGVRERKRGVFYRRSAAFVHFHEDPAGIFADVRSGGEWTRLPVNTQGERDRFLRLVKESIAKR